MTDIYFFDTDCLSSFLLANQEHILIELFTKRIVVPSFVYEETMHKKELFAKIVELENEGHLIKRDIKYGTPEYKTYLYLTKSNKNDMLIGKGEASAIAMAKHNNGILASNNFKDIAKYIDEYNLKYTCTGDILIEAMNKSLIDEKQGNKIWKTMLDNGRYLPTKTFSLYLKTNNT